MRITQFNILFKKNYPDLFRHFETLDLTSDLFLIDWLSTLFVKNIDDLALVSRIWDNFHLDGEVFGIKVALAIIGYFERKFMKESHFKIIS